jgi:hypothetical protein
MSEQDPVFGFEALEDPPGVEVVDRIEQLRYRLHADRPVSPTPIDTDPFYFPVDSAVEITAEEIVLPTVVTVCIRDSAGEMVTEVGHLDEGSVGDGSYILELGAQIKTYVEVTGPIETTATLLETRIEFDGPTELRVGAQSWHDRPAATVTTTADPHDMMAAVSTFGSALKTTSPERSFPSLRGHPPAVRLGDQLKIPDSIEVPETGIRLELPPTRGAVYAAAPLAYYLGAEVVAGSEPRLVTDRGFEHSLSSPKSFEENVERTLKRLFVLDCVTRTEGLYEIDLRARNELEEYVGLDWGRLYEQSLAEQVATYLEVPYALLEDVIPEWRLTAHVEPTGDTVEQLPFVVDDLAIVRTAATPGAAQPGTESTGTLTRSGVLTRSAAEGTEADAEGPSYVQPQSSGSLEQAWIGDRIPVGASKLTAAAFRNRLDRETTEGDISITVVSNDPRMGEERDLVGDVYGDRENLPFDVRMRRDLSVEALREEFRADRSFLHYIGHTERDGFECADGKLDAATLDSAGVDAFLLNACNSYQQGLALIEAGAVGGIVTLNDIINDGAVRIGELIARLLNAGFPLRAALTIARGESVLGGQYIVVGDGGATVTQAVSRTPNILDVTPEGDGFELRITTYATDDAGLGSVFKPHVSGNDEHFLSSGEIASFHVSSEELIQLLELENVPVRHGGDILWSQSLDIDDLSGMGSSRN